MKIKYLLILFAALTLSAVSCSDDKPGENECTENCDPPGTDIDPDNDTWGVLTDGDGNLLQGVVVSDSYTCVVTDKNGVYQFKRNRDAMYVYYVIPEEYEVPIDPSTQRPRFYEELKTGTDRYDFELKKLAAVENDFVLFGLADPQVTNQTEVLRFQNESVPDVKAHGSAQSLPVYGVTLGDIVGDKPDFYTSMANLMSLKYIGIPVFQVLGNHDHFNTADGDLESQRRFESVFGPVNYSFNRGKAHVVCMDNILHHTNGTSGAYDPGFREDQYEWLRQNLSHVPKDKLLLICVHIPFRTGWSSSVQPKTYYDEVLELISDFAEVHILAGHTHNHRYHRHNKKGKEIYEHILGTVCGAWWNSTVNTDGTPNGYGVFEISGNTVKDWYYKPTKYDRDFQIRMYRGSDIFGQGGKTWQFPYKNDNQIVANIWGADNTWTVEVYEDGVKTGNMTTYTGYDFWSTAYHVAVRGRNESNYSKSTPHMFHYTLADGNAEVRIEATDNNGNKYTQDVFTTSDPADYPDGY